MGDYNRHAKYRRNTLPRSKGATQLYGEGGDTGMWYKCRHCGFINRIDRALKEDSYEGGNGSQVQEYDGLTPSAFGTGDQRYACLTLDLHSVRLMQLDSDGNIVAPYAPRYSKVTGGCAFCGSFNWR